MNDKIYFENYLLILKSTVEVYIHGTLESSNQLIRETLKSSLNEIIDNQARTFDLMKNNGWYEINNIPNTEIVNTLKKLEN